MDTAYKTRAFWMLRALTYFADAGESGTEQAAVWRVEGAKAARNAVAPAGSEALTRRTVDRSGNLLPAFVA